ncbi:MAG: hypothetical protein KAS71_13455 [Bacteroidales bacterium]|nr:hypothetical protein [Bacteroidales bacterium]
MNRNSAKDNFLINAEYVFNKLRIRSVFYATIIILALTFILSFAFRFSVNFTFNGEISQAYTYKSDDSTKLLADKIIEIQLNQALSDLFKNRQNIKVEITDGNIPIYKGKCNIVQYSSYTNNNHKAYKAIIARNINEGQVEFFPSNLSGNYKTKIIIDDVRIKLSDLLNLIILKDLCSIEINHFS